MRIVNVFANFIALNIGASSSSLIDSELFSMSTPGRLVNESVGGLTAMELF